MSLFYPKFWLSIFRPIFSHLHKTWILVVLKARLKGRLHSNGGVRINSLKGFQCGQDIFIGFNTKVMLNHEAGQADLKLKIGNGVKLGDRNQIAVSPGQTMIIGDGSSTHAGCYLSGDIEIGRGCLLSSNIFISSTDHHYNLNPNLTIRDQDRLAIQSGARTSLRTVIEDDCWIGWGSVIKRGLTMGRGSILGANSVLTQSLPPFSIAVGSPAKVIRRRVDIRPVLRIEAKREEHVPLMSQGVGLLMADLRSIDGSSCRPLYGQGRFLFAKENFHSISLRVHAEFADNLDLLVNGNLISTCSLKAGWNEIELTVSAQNFVMSDRRLSHLSEFHIVEIRTSTEKTIFFEFLEIRKLT